MAAGVEGSEGSAQGFDLVARAGLDGGMGLDRSARMGAGAVEERVLRAVDYWGCDQ